MIKGNAWSLFLNLKLLSHLRSNRWVWEMSVLLQLFLLQSLVSHLLLFYKLHKEMRALIILKVLLDILLSHAIRVLLFNLLKIMNFVIMNKHFPLEMLLWIGVLSKFRHLSIALHLCCPLYRSLPIASLLNLWYPLLTLLIIFVCTFISLVCPLSLLKYSTLFALLLHILYKHLQLIMLL